MATQHGQVGHMLSLTDTAARGDGHRKRMVKPFDSHLQISMVRTSSSASDMLDPSCMREAVFRAVVVSVGSGFTWVFGPHGFIILAKINIPVKLFVLQVSPWIKNQRSTVACVN